MVDMLELEKRLMDSGMPIESISSPADIVAKGLDPNATSYRDKINALESATPSRIDRVVKGLESNSGFTRLVSNDFNAESAYASSILGAVTHSFEGSSSGGPGGSGSSQLQTVQMRIDRLADDTVVFGSGITSAEFSNVIMDSLIIVVPAASILIVFFLIYSYRDPVDLGLGVFSLVMAMV
jgi:predicted RND superfamily exporter protein